MSENETQAKAKPWYATKGGTVVLVILVVVVLAGVAWLLYPRQQAQVPTPPPGMGGAPAIATTPDGLPAQMGSLPLTKKVEGQAALDEIAKLHGKGLGISKGWVLTYGDKSGQVTAWISETKDANAAQELLNTMLKKMEGNKTFTAPQALSMPSVTMYQTTGMGQSHYFWAKGNKVIWLAAQGSVDLMPVVQTALYGF